MPGPDVEIERKYLLRGLPPEAEGAPSAVVEQGYVPGSVIRERIRLVRDDAGERYVRTVKLGRGVARQEFEEETTKEIFDALWVTTPGRRVHKRRYFVRSGGLTWEIDAFTDRELYLAELEIPSVAFPIVIPPWLAGYVERDVTDDDRYGNFQLAR